MKSLIKTLIQFRTLKGRIIASFLIFLIVPFFIVSYFMDKPLERIIEGKIGDSTQNTLNITALSIDNLLEGMLSSITLFSLNKNLVSILKNPEMFSDYEKQTSSSYIINSAVNTYLWNTDSFTTIMDLKQNVYATWMRTKDEHARLAKLPWFAEILGSDGNFIWIFHEQNFIENNNRHLISVARLIDEFRYGDFYGIAMISIYEDNLRKVMQKSNKDGNSDIMLIDQNGMVISHTNGTRIGENILKESYFEKIIANQQGHTVSEINGEKTIINYCTISKANWKIVHITPYMIYFKEIDNIKYLKMVVWAVIFILFIIITISISLRVTKPLKELRDKMVNLKEQTLNQPIQVNGRDEIADLIFAYNKMTRTITTLLQNIKAEQKQKEEMKFKALQAQINPHFILNTLNNIRFMAYMSQAREVGEMITALGAIMEESMGRGNDIITLKQELEYIRNYVYLQKIRYNEKLSVSYIISDDVMECLVFKFILQPIVENCIYHGIESLKTKGKIEIAAERTGTDLSITVKDNGIGIEDDKLAEIRSCLENRKQPMETGRIGLKNIHERIRLNYGDDYGIRIDSVLNEGTTIGILLPYSKIIV